MALGASSDAMPVELDAVVSCMEVKVQSSFRASDVDTMLCSELHLPSRVRLDVSESSIPAYQVPYRAIPI